MKRVYNIGYLEPLYQPHEENNARFFCRTKRETRIPIIYGQSGSSSNMDYFYVKQLTIELTYPIVQYFRCAKAFFICFSWNTYLDEFYLNL